MANLHAVDAARGRVLVAVLAAAGISVSLMQTLVIPLVPQLPTLLGTSASDASWAITATLLTGAIATPVLGRLGDMYGPKRILVACAVVLTVGSVIAALTTSLVPLIIGRGLQGFGAPVIPLGISVLRAALPAERVGSAMGLMSASLGVGGALGLPLSAVIAEHFNWHALFWCAAALGVMSAVLFALLVPEIRPVAKDRFDPLGAIGLAAALVLLLLPISKGATWGWTSATTLAMFGASVVVFVVFGWWQYRAPSPIVDMRTTLRRPVLLTNVASIAMGFGMFAMSLVGPQILQMPSATGYGLGQSMVAAGLWMAPSGLAMMISAPIAARIIATRGPKFTLLVGAVTVAAGYLSGTQLIGTAAGVLVFAVIVSVGVGFGFASLPALINSAVPVSETASANGINTLARSLGTSTSSAVMSAVLAQMTVTVGGHVLPSLNGFRTALLIAALAAVGAAVIALAIPRVTRRPDEPPAPVPQVAVSQAGDLEQTLAGLGRHMAGDPPDPAYRVLRRVEPGPATAHELGRSSTVPESELHRQLSRLVREGLLRADRAANPTQPATFSLTSKGHEVLNRHRAPRVHFLQRATADWDAGDVAALIGYVGRLTASIDRERRNRLPTSDEPETERLAVRTHRQADYRAHPGRVHHPVESRPPSPSPATRPAPEFTRGRWMNARR